MKTIIAVTFIGILTYACAEEPSNKFECKQEPMANFNPTKYLQITRAFATHSMEGSGATICRLYKTKESRNQIDTNIYQYYLKRRDIYYSEDHCNTTVESIKNGKFVSSCIRAMVTDRRKGTTKISKPSIIKVYTSVIDTDYDKYIIHYRCIKTKSSIMDNIEVLQTNINAGDEPIKQALEKLGMELDDFIAHKDPPEECKNIDNGLEIYQQEDQIVGNCQISLSSSHWCSCVFYGSNIIDGAFENPAPDKILRQ